MAYFLAAQRKGAASACDQHNGRFGRLSILNRYRPPLVVVKARTCQVNPVPSGLALSQELLRSRGRHLVSQSLPRLVESKTSNDLQLIVGVPNVADLLAVFFRGAPHEAVAEGGPPVPCRVSSLRVSMMFALYWFGTGRGKRKIIRKDNQKQ